MHSFRASDYAAYAFEARRAEPIANRMTITPRRSPSVPPARTVQ